MIEDKKKNVDAYDTNNFMVSEHFNLREFMCPESYQVIVNKNMVEMLEWLRKEIGEPVIITSGYRNCSYNKKIGGHPFSLHMQGKAVDIANTNPKLKDLIEHIFVFSYYNSKKKYFHCQIENPKNW